MPRPDELGFDLLAAGQSLLLALLFLLLAAFPGQLLNKTWEENYAEINGWFRRGGRLGARLKVALDQFWRHRVGILVFIVLSALLYGFLSPEFGPTAESAAALIGILVGLGVVVAVFELPIVFAQRRVLKDRGRMRVLPLTILIAIVCVLLSRLAEFQPGYLYGLVAGWAFAGSLELRDEARAHVMTGVWMLIVAVGAWLLLPLAEDSLAGQPLLDMAVAAGLATIFVAGLEGLLFELVPLRFLRGEKVYEWRRGVWAALFLAAGFAFAYILLNPTAGYLGTTRLSPLVPAVLLFVGFGIVSVLFWAYFRYRPAREPIASD